MACRLGSCRADSYRVIVRDRSGPEIAELDFSALEWDRRLDDISEAKVTVPPSCCGKLADIWPWRHELAVSRDGEEVWAGPVRVIANCTSGIILTASDVLGWLEHRVIHNDHDWTPLPGIGAVPAAVELIQDGFVPDDPDVLKYLTSYGTGVIGGRSYLANSKYTYDALKDLAQGSLDFTVIGRRIVVMESGYELGTTTLVTCDHFADDVCTVLDGDAAMTRAVVTGVGVTGSAGGVDPYFGLLETLVDDQNIGRQSTADDQAAGLLRGANPPPLYVQPPQGSGGLNPDTPICLSELVPGVTVPVSVNCTCRTALQDMRLSKLTVNVSAGGETIAPLLVPLGFNAAGNGGQ
jgi:hypothetical protein